MRLAAPPSAEIHGVYGEHFVHLLAVSSAMHRTGYVAVENNLSC
jgi:hypothetical protein